MENEIGVIGYLVELGVQSAFRRAGRMSCAIIGIVGIFYTGVSEFGPLISESGTRAVTSILDRVANRNRLVV